MHCPCRDGRIDFIDSFSELPVRICQGAILNRKLFLMSDNGTTLVTCLVDDPDMPFSNAAVVVNPSLLPSF